MAKSKKISVKMNVEKYFQYHGDTVHPYTQAFVGNRFHGIIKTKEEWEKELIQYMEDDKC